MAYDREREHGHSHFTTELHRCGDTVFRESLLIYVFSQFKNLTNVMSCEATARLSYCRTIIQQILKNEPNLATKTNESSKKNLFHEAAKIGNEALMSDIIEAVVGYALMDPNSPQHLSDALIAKDRLLKTPLSYAVEKRNTKLLGILVQHKIPEEELLKPLELSIEARDLSIFKALLDSSHKLLTPNIVRMIVKQKAVSIWEYIFAEFCVSCLETEDILHFAVEWGSVEVVEAILSYGPKLIRERDVCQKSVFHYIKRRQASAAEQAKLRNILVPLIIRDGGEDGLSIERVRKYLMESRGPQELQSEISLNLSAFNEEINNFPLFVAHLKNKDTATTSLGILPGFLKLEFESTLRYVQFPNLDLVSPIDESPIYHQPRDEVPTVLKWLRKKGVTEIVELVVPDSFTHPHNEETIEEAIKDFRIQILHWQRLDLSIHSIAEAGPNLRTLHLYSSGNRGILDHWTGLRGVVRLTALQELYVHIVENMISKARAADLKKEAEKRFKELEERKMWGKDISCVASIKWGSHKFEKVSEIHDPVFLSSPSIATRLPSFLEAYGNIQRQREGDRPLQGHIRRTKVAILDNGIDLANNHLEYSDALNNVKTGKSFVYRGEKDSAWCFASHLHGTHMASFIAEMDPECELYIAKICEKTHIINAEAVVNALDWAVNECEVDIISMSLILTKSCPGLENAVIDAAKTAVIICSTADDGNNDPDNCLSKFTNNTISVASCNYYGIPAPYSTQNGARYFLHGENMVPFSAVETKSQRGVSGSSVATAVASGLASLVLSCHQIANGGANPDDVMNESKATIVNRHFQEMTRSRDSPSSDSKYVKPWVLFPEEVNSSDKALEFVNGIFSRLKKPNVKNKRPLKEESDEHNGNEMKRAKTR